MADAIKISIELADKAAQKALSDFVTKGERADKTLKNVGETGNKTFSDMSLTIGKAAGTFEIFAGNLAASVAKTGLDALASAAKGLFDTFVVEGVKAAQEEEAALNSLNVALAKAGQYTGDASKSFQDFAADIQSSTTVADDAVYKNAALIESLARLDQDGLKRATKAAIELSAAFDIDLQTASLAVGKAASGNVTALQRLGLSFEKAGTDAGTFENVLSSIESTLGGTAASKIRTFEGAASQLTNVFGDLQEAIGGTITQNPVVLAAFGAVSDIIKEVTGAVGENNDVFKALVGQGLITLIDVSAAVIVGLDAVLRTVLGLGNGILTVVHATGALGYALIGAVDLAKSSFEAMKESFDATKASFSDDSFLGDMSVQLYRVRDSAQVAFDKMSEGAQTASVELKNNTNLVNELTDAQERQQKNIDSFTQGLADKANSSKEYYAQELQLLTEQEANKNALLTESELVDYDARLARQKSYLDLKNSLLAEQFAKEQATVEQSSLDGVTKYQAKLQLEIDYQNAVAKLKAEANIRDKKLKDEQLRNERAFNQAKTQAAADLFGAIGSIAALGGKKAFEVAKAFNLAEAITTGILAVQKAVASAPPPFNIPAIVSTTAISVANVARIASTQAPSFEDGGIVPGTSFSGDNVRANVNSGEMILNRRQQANLFDIANNGGSTAGKLDQAIGLLTQVLAQPLSVQIDGKELINITRTQLASGRTFA